MFPKDVKSLPVRERGLKRLGLCNKSQTGASLPVRERGLKLGDVVHLVYESFVASRAGAWIEAMPLANAHGNVFVASRAGAWIEAAGRGRAGP